MTPIAVEAEVVVDLPPPREHVVELELAEFPPPRADSRTDGGEIIEIGGGAAAEPSHERQGTMEIYDNPMQQKHSGSISGID